MPNLETLTQDLYARSQAGLARQRLSNRTIARLQSELIAAKFERDAARTECTVLRVERDLERDLSARCLAELDSAKDALARYNPEVISRQEELCDIEALLAREANVNTEELSRSALTGSCPLRGGPLARMRQGLSYLGVRRGPDSHLIDGHARYQEFWEWLTTRPEIEAANESAPYAGYVNSTRCVPPFNEEANRVCKSRPLFVDTLAFWQPEPADRHYGVFICPDYKYNPAKQVWTLTDESYACGEQTREVFYVVEGKTYYAGTYMCHTGPAHVRVHHLGALGTEDLLESIAVRTRCSGKRRADEKHAIAELYREGTLTVRVIGLERVGFNQQLHKVLITDCSRREGRKAERRREKRTRRGTHTGPPHPAPAPIPQDIMDLLHPSAFPVAIGVKCGRDEYEEDGDYWYGDEYRYGDEYEDEYEEDEQPPWKVPKVEYEGDEVWEDEGAEVHGEYYGQEVYDEEEEYDEEGYGAPVKLEDCEYY